MIQLLEIGLLALILFYMQQTIYKKLWNRHLTASLFFKEKAIFQGEEGEICEIITNRKHLPLSMLKVRFQTDRHLLFDAEKGSRTTDKYYRNDVLHINGGEKLTRSIRFVGGKRGFYQIESMDLVGSDLFYTMEFVQTLPIQTSLYVYPKPFNSEEFRLELKQLNGEILTKQHLLEDPFEYRGIREYQPYDELKSINWKATAKTGQLKVNQKNYTALPSLRIFFDVEDRGVLKNEDCVEATFRIAAGLASFFLSRGMQVSCYGNGLDIHTSKPLWMDEKTGIVQLEQLYQALARIDMEKPTVDFVETFQDKLLTSKSNVFTCIIAFHQYPPFLELMNKCKNVGNGFIWFYPVWDSTNPAISPDIENSVRFIHIRK
ncbi:MAG: DUF58 domain-containing protein [Acetatifactor sp.]|nr:DUF58 domain-containing protein [Acetatifactor sp.]